MTRDQQIARLLIRALVTVIKQNAAAAAQAQKDAA